MLNDVMSKPRLLNPDLYTFFKIINFPTMCSNIPASPAYGAYISQLIRYARASSNYSDFLKRHLYQYWDKIGIIVVNAVLYENPSFNIVSAECFN
jgi:hypothetical protein